MKIKTELKKGILNKQANELFYAELRKANVENRLVISLEQYEPHKEYTFIGTQGTVTVTFEPEDFVM